MKKLIIAIILLVFIVTSSIIEVYAVKNTCNKLEKQLIVLQQQVEVNTEEINTQSNNQQIEKVIKYYDKSKSLLLALSHHMMAHELERTFYKIKAVIQSNNYNDFAIELACALSYIDQILDGTKVSPQNLA